MGNLKVEGLLQPGDVMVVSSIAKADFLSVDNLLGIATGGLQSAITGLGIEIGMKLLMHAAGLKTEQQVIAERLSEIAENVKKLENLHKDRQLSDKLLEYNRLTGKIEDQIMRWDKVGASPSAAVIDASAAFTSLVGKASWTSIAGDLIWSITGNKQGNAFAPNLTNSTLDAYSDRLLEKKVSVKEYAEALQNFLSSFGRSIGQIAAAVAIAAKVAKNAGRLGEPEYKKCIQDVKDDCDAVLNAVSRHVRSMNPQAFDLHSALWVRKEGYRCYVTLPKTLEELYWGNFGSNLDMLIEAPLTRSRSHEWEIIAEGDEGHVRLRLVSIPEKYLSQVLENEAYSDSDRGKLLTLRPGKKDWKLIAAKNSFVFITEQREKALKRSSFVPPSGAWHQLNYDRGGMPSNYCRATQDINLTDTEMQWRLVRYSQLSRVFGGSGGKKFDDVVQCGFYPTGVAAVRVWTTKGGPIRGIQFKYWVDGGDALWAERHGNDGGPMEEFTLNEDKGRREGICEIKGTYDDTLNSVQFITDQDRSSKVFGVDKGKSFHAKGLVLGFYGSSGERIDSLGIHWRNRAPRATAYHGGPGGPTSFDDLNGADSPIEGIETIRVWNEDGVLRGIQVIYRLVGGGTFEAPVHGKTPGVPYEHQLDCSKLMCIEGEVGGFGTAKVVKQFKTYKNALHRPKYAPSGFCVAGDIVAIFGRCGEAVDSLGFYLRSHETPAATLYRGGGGGEWFDDLLDIGSPVERIRRIKGWFEDDRMTGLQVTYVVRGGIEVDAPLRGKATGTPMSFEVDLGEDIIEVRGNAGDLLHGLRFTFRTIKDGKAVTQTHDTWGGNGGHFFSDKGRIVGFFGRAGGAIDGIGAYLAPDLYKDPDPGPKAKS